MRPDQKLIEDLKKTKKRVSEAKIKSVKAALAFIVNDDLGIIEKIPNNKKYVLVDQNNDLMFFDDAELLDYVNSSPSLWDGEDEPGF